jgi:hypothetical protein
MVARSIESVNELGFSRIVLVGLQQLFDLHKINPHKFIETIETIIDKKVELVFLDEPTSSQPETVYNGIIKANIDGPIVVRDCDSWAKSNDSPKELNFVGVCSISNQKSVSAANKSYVEEVEGNIVGIVEKKVISDRFCVGTYGFKSAQDYLEGFQTLSPLGNLYVSDIVQWMITRGNIFYPLEVNEYYDWGTLEDWLRYKRKYRTIFCDLDGILSENHNYMSSSDRDWNSITPIRNNIMALKEMIDSGFVELVITTSRSDKFAVIIEEELQALGLRKFRIITGLLHSERILVNDFAPTNPYPTASAINLARNSDNLSEFIFNNEC